MLYQNWKGMGSWPLSCLHCHDITVFTEHAALQSLLKAPKLSGRLMWWSLKLQQFMPTIKHQPWIHACSTGSLVPNATWGSSARSHELFHCPGGRQARRYSTWISLLPGELELAIGSLQQEDATLNAIIDYLKSGVLPEDPMQARHLALERPRFSLVDGNLFHKDPGLPGRLQLVVPRQVQEQLIQGSCNGRFSGHFTEKLTWETLRMHF